MKCPNCGSTKHEKCSGNGELANKAASKMLKKFETAQVKPRKEM